MSKRRRSAWRATLPSSLRTYSHPTSREVSQPRRMRCANSWNAPRRWNLSSHLRCGRVWPPWTSLPRASARVCRTHPNKRDGTMSRCSRVPCRFSWSVCTWRTIARRKCWTRVTCPCRTFIAPISNMTDLIYPLTYLLFHRYFFLQV